MTMITLAFIALAITLSAIKFILSRRKIYSTFTDLDVQGPKPNIFFGNIKAFYKQPLEFVANMIKEYGDFSGFFIGPIPVVITKDLDIIKDILIKKFDNFTNRTKYPLLQVNPLQDSVLSLRDERWRSVRSVLSPFFTTSKMRRCTKLMNEMANVLAEKVGKESKDGFNCYEPSQKCVMDILLQCVLGINERIQEKSSHAIFTMIQSFSADMRSTMLKIGYIFPFLMKITNFLTRYFSQGKKLKKVQSFVEKVIEFKKESDHTVSGDFLSLMLKFNDENTNQSERLSDNELLAASLSFLLVGFDTTASSIAYCLHVLSHHQMDQEVLYNEIKNVVESDGNFNYEDLMYKMPYLDQVYKETLRMFPPFPVFSTREAKQTYMKNGVTIPSGSSVMIPIKELHYDSKLWDEPEVFNPDRFSPENAKKIPSMAYQPFLNGSRNCIGKNLGILISKLVIAKIVLNYHILPMTEKMELAVSGITTSAVNYPKSGTDIKLKLRG